MFENRKCERCNRVATSRNVLREVLDVYKCRGCGNEFQRTTTQSFSDRDAMLLDQLSRINDWLSKLRAVGHEVIETEKDKAWTIDKCELVFEHGLPGSMDLRLTTAASGSLADKVERMYDDIAFICAAHGLQPITISSERTEQGRKTVTVTFGAQQSLAVHVNVAAELFPPIVKRMEAAIAEIAKRLQS